MKRISSLLLAIICLAFPISADGQDNASFDRWHSDKYSMFIHFGLYSWYGGVWDGKPVTSGYSEQIQSHGGIFGDWYASAAYEFDPVSFDADEIAALARKAGMRSIVFTSKHHDGFCMFDTATTGYDSVEMTPSGRDYVGELAQACASAGLKFGLYFSLIDWNFPHAYPISSHNADPVTPQHHQLNKDQVTELLENYGSISELWFDMGALTPQQSKELYDLVKHLQPDCMVSGRLGNDMYDFAVMPDNFYPDGSLQTPWQSAASMFNETWGWRSWQERGKVEDKAAEKLRSLINVVSHGGNYLLNIGPDSRGAVVPFEKDVLLEIGKWLDANPDAVYGTDASPFRQDFDWGAVTVKGKLLYLILSGSYPEDGKAVLPMPDYRLKKVRTPGVKVRKVVDNVMVTLDESMYADPMDIKVICLEFDKEIRPSSGSADYSYSCFDYYSNYKSTVAYSWTYDAPSFLVYTEEEVGRRIAVEIDGNRSELTLDDDISAELPEAVFEMGETRYSRLNGSGFNAPLQWKVYSSEDLSSMKVSAQDDMHFKVTGPRNYVLVRELNVTSAGYAEFEICSGNGVEFVLDGKTMMKHLNPYGTRSRTEKVLVYLTEGEHQVLLRGYNRFEKELNLMLKKTPVNVFRHELPNQTKGAHTVRVSAADLPSVHTDCCLHNLHLLEK
jgi:alpha-L-fucosidase